LSSLGNPTGENLEIERKKAEKEGKCALFIFQDEWQNRRNLLEAMIKYRLGLSDIRLGARSCSLKELEPSVRKKFFEAYHLEGDTRAFYSYGLCDESGDVVAAISVRKPFHKSVAKDDTLEIARFAVRSGTSVPGALSRLTKVSYDRALLEGAKQLISYVDGRIGEGRSYEAAGFKFERRTAPRFWWADGVRRYNRFKIRADSKNGITQRENANKAGVLELYGCSNSVYVLRK
jgi:hypothetical protein